MVSGDRSSFSMIYVGRSDRRAFNEKSSLVPIRPASRGGVSVALAATDFAATALSETAFVDSSSFLSTW